MKFTYLILALIFAANSFSQTSHEKIDDSINFLEKVFTKEGASQSFVNEALGFTLTLGGAGYSLVNGTEAVIVHKIRKYTAPIAQKAQVVKNVTDKVDNLGKQVSKQVGNVTRKLTIFSKLNRISTKLTAKVIPQSISSKVGGASKAVAKSAVVKTFAKAGVDKLITKFVPQANLVSKAYGVTKWGAKISTMTDDVAKGIIRKNIYSSIIGLGVAVGGYYLISFDNEVDHKLSEEEEVLGLFIQGTYDERYDLLEANPKLLEQLYEYSQKFEDS